MRNITYLYGFWHNVLKIVITFYFHILLKFTNYILQLFGPFPIINSHSVQNQNIKPVYIMRPITILYSRKRYNLLTTCV